MLSISCCCCHYQSSVSPRHAKMPLPRMSKTFKEIKHNLESQAKRRITVNPDDEEAYVDKQRGISVVLEGEGGAGDLKGDIQKSGLYGCEEDESIPYLVFTFIYISYKQSCLSVYNVNCFTLEMFSVLAVSVILKWENGEML